MSIKIRNNEELTSRLTQITGDIAELEYLQRKYMRMLEQLRKYEESKSEEPFMSDKNDKLTYRAYYDIRDLDIRITQFEMLPEWIKARAKVERDIALESFNFDEQKAYQFMFYVAIRLYQIIFDRPHYMLNWYNANKAKYSKYISDKAIQDNVDMIKYQLGMEE